MSAFFNLLDGIIIAFLVMTVRNLAPRNWLPDWFWVIAAAVVALRLLIDVLIVIGEFLP